MVKGSETSYIHLLHKYLMIQYRSEMLLHENMALRHLTGKHTTLFVFRLHVFFRGRFWRDRVDLEMYIKLEFYPSRYLDSGDDSHVSATVWLSALQLSAI